MWKGLISLRNLELKNQRDLIILLHVTLKELQKRIKNQKEILSDYNIWAWNWVISEAYPPPDSLAWVICTLLQKVFLSTLTCDI